MIIEQTENRVNIIPCVERNGVVNNKITLLPGCNDVDDELWKKARVSVKDKIERGLIKEHHAKVEEKEVPIPNTDKKRKVIKIDSKDLKDLEPEEAEEIVKNTFSLKTLGKWKKSESRDSVRNVILNQIEQVEKHGEEKPKGQDKGDK